MSPRIIAAVLAVLAVWAPAAAAATKPKGKATPLDLTLKLGYVDAPSSVGTIVGAVSGKGIRAGGFRVRLTASGDRASGPVAIYDGLGRIDGTLTLAQTRDSDDTIVLKGTLTVSGGAGRWARATGRLAFAGALDDTSVPDRAVVRATAKGTVTATPAAAPRATKPRSRKVDLSGDESMVDFAASGPTTTSAALLGGTGPKPGIVVWRRGAPTGDAVAATFVLYTATGTVTGGGTLSNTNRTATVGVTGGTGLYKGASGKLRWSATTTGSNPGRFTSRLRGKLTY